MSQVTTVAQIKAHDGVTGLQASEVDRRVGLATAVGCTLAYSASKLTGTVTRQIFHLVDNFTSSIVALARIALCVLVG